MLCGSLGTRTTQMRSEWTDKATSLLNRGFPRMYILSMIKDRPMDAKEIIENLLINSGGTWKPSPKSIYHLLAKLVEEDLLYQTDRGQYALTSKGIRVASDAGKVSKTLKTLKKRASSFIKLSNLTDNAYVSKLRKRFL